MKARERKKRERKKEKKKVRKKETNKNNKGLIENHLDSSLELNLSGDEEEHVAGAVDVLMVGGEEGGRGPPDASILDAADESESGIEGYLRYLRDVR